MCCAVWDYLSALSLNLILFFAYLLLLYLFFAYLLLLYLFFQFQVLFVIYLITKRVDKI